MRELEFRAWNSKSEMMLSWGLLRVSPILLSKLIKGSVDNHTIMQFTGLLDKNGVKIFEGDKLSQVSRQEVFTVIWLDGEPVSLREIGEPLNSKVINHYSLIVIGNIHEDNHE